MRKLEQYSNSKWKRLANYDEIKKYEEMISYQSKVIDQLNQEIILEFNFKESDKKKKSIIGNDDDLDHMRSKMPNKQEKSDSNEIVKIKK